MRGREAGRGRAKATMRRGHAASVGKAGRARERRCPFVVCAHHLKVHDVVAFPLALAAHLVALQPLLTAKGSAVAAGRDLCHGCLRCLAGPAKNELNDAQQRFFCSEQSRQLQLTSPHVDLRRDLVRRVLVRDLHKSPSWNRALYSPDSVFCLTPALLPVAVSSALTHISPPQSASTPLLPSDDARCHRPPCRCP